MFALIITVVSIAIGAALALSTIYYGGDTVNEGVERALVSQIDVQGQQILGAMEVYHAEKGVYPAALADLVTTRQLAAVPTVYAPGSTTRAEWALVAPGEPVIVLRPVSVATCMAYNTVQFGIGKILKAPHTTQPKSCYGTDTAHLTIVQSKTGSDLASAANAGAALVALGPVVTEPIPLANSVDATNAGWLEVAGTDVAQAPQGSACPLTLTQNGGYNGDAGLVNNTAAPIAVTRFNGFIDNGSGASSPYYFVMADSSQGGLAMPGTNIWDTVDTPWVASSVGTFEAPAEMPPGASIAISHAYGPQGAAFKMAVYLPAQNVWCGVLASNPDGRWGDREMNTIYNLVSWTGADWAAPAEPAPDPAMFLSLTGTPVNFGLVRLNAAASGSTTIHNPSTRDRNFGLYYSGAGTLNFSTTSPGCVVGTIKAGSSCVYDIAYVAPGWGTSDNGSIDLGNGADISIGAVAYTVTLAP